METTFWNYYYISENSFQFFVLYLHSRHYFVEQNIKTSFQKLLSKIITYISILGIKSIYDSKKLKTIEKGSVHRKKKRVNRTFANIYLK